MYSAYEIIDSKCNNYRCIVIPIAINNPLAKVEDLQSELKRKKIKSGSIVFDFIFSAGNGEERYATVKYDGSFVNNTFKYIALGKRDPIRIASSDFLKDHLGTNLSCMLNKSQVLLLQKGVTL